MIKINSNLSSGVIEKNIVIVNNGAVTNTTGNYWVDWAIGFQDFCVNTLGLEVEAGPGTSVGIIQTGYGPVRYQYDCDWNEEFGRVKTFNGETDYIHQEKGFTLWSDDPLTLWSQITGQNGIDAVNRRFDFIVWFTVQDENKGRLGLRFKYPLTNERGYYTSYYISPSPFIQPWYESGDNVNYNYSRISDKWGTYGNSRTGYISLTNDKIITDSYCSVGNLGISRTTQSFADVENKLWADYAQGDESKISYEELGGNFASGTDYSLSKITSLNPGHIMCFVSKNKHLINIKVVNINSKVQLDLMYGDLMDDNGVTNSFVSVKTYNIFNNNKIQESILMTDNHYNVGTTAQINRPTENTYNYSSYWAISRLLLQEEVKHCEELYQVFSFADTMSNHIYRQIAFIDSNNNTQMFILFNYGIQNTNNNFNNAVLLAMPI